MSDKKNTENFNRASIKTGGGDLRIDIGDIYYTDSSNLNDLISKISKEFYQGKIKESLSSLSELINKNSENIKSKKDLLVKKAEFLLSLKKDKQFIELMEYIELNYKISFNFDFLNISRLIMENKQKALNVLKSKLIFEEQISKESLELFICFYTGNFDKSIEVFKKNEKKLTETKDIYLGVMSFLMKSLNDFDYKKKGFELFDLYFKNEKNYNFIEKLNLILYKGNVVFNVYLKTKTIEISTKELEQMLVFLDKIIKIDFNLFSSVFQNEIINIKLCLLYILDYNKYNQEIIEYSDSLIAFHYYQFLLIRSDVIEILDLEIFVEKNGDDNIYLLHLDRLMFLNENLNAIDFIENKDLLSKNNDMILVFYIDSMIKEKKKISIDLLNKIESNVTNIKFFILKIKYLKEEKKLTDDVLNKLLELSCLKENEYTDITEIIKIFYELKHKDIAMNIFLFYKNTHPNLFYWFLEILKKDKQLLYFEFDQFINKLEDEEKLINSDLIGNNYLQFANQKTAIEYYWKCWEFKPSKDIAKTIFINGLDLNLLDERIEKIVSYLNINNGFDNIFYKLLKVEYLYKKKNYSNAFKILNTILINKEFSDFEADELFVIEKLYVKSLINKDLKFNEYNENILIIRDEKLFINDIYKDSIKESSKLIPKTDTEIYILKEEKNSVNSLCHFLLNKYFDKFNSMIKVKIPENASGKEILEKLIKVSKVDETKKMFENFENGDNNISLYYFVNGLEKFPKLIDDLLNENNKDKNYFRVPNKISNKKKILSFSSLVFLNNLDLLSEIKKREDVYLQKSVSDWIKECITKLSTKDKYSELVFSGKKIINDITKEEINNDKKYWLKFLETIDWFEKNDKVIDDEKTAYIMKDNELKHKLNIFMHNSIALTLNDKYQLITENIGEYSFIQGIRTIDNEIYPTNTISILKMMDIEKYIELLSKLYESGYQNLIAENEIQTYLKLITHEDLLTLCISKKKNIKLYFDLLSKNNNLNLFISYLKELKYKPYHIKQKFTIDKNIKILKILKII